MTYTTSMIIAVLGAFFAVVSGLFFLTGRAASRQPHHYDGIGGKDTDNLIVGCAAPLIGLVLGSVSVVCLIVAGITALCGL